MELFEIDHIEVTDLNIEVTYWNSDYNKNNSIMFRTDSFEEWLLNQRNVSISAYWDHWEPTAINSPGYQIVLDDMKQFLFFKFGSFTSTREKMAPAYSDKKPMKRVSGANAGKSGSKSA